MKKTVFWLLCCQCAAAYADNTAWWLVGRAVGDLNGDGRPDKAEVWQAQDPAKIISNHGLGEANIDTNPRVLKIRLANGRGGHDLLSEDAGFIPPAGNAESPCLADPLESDGIAIDKGRLKISLSYWYSCGTWYASREDYTFRYEKQTMRLIGLEVREWHRGSGSISETSYNYLTGRKKETRGGNIDGKRPTEIKWTKLPRQPFYRLGGNMPKPAE